MTRALLKPDKTPAKQVTIDELLERLKRLEEQVAALSPPKAAR